MRSACFATEVAPPVASEYDVVLPDRRMPGLGGDTPTASWGNVTLETPAASCS